MSTYYYYYYFYKKLSFLDIEISTKEKGQEVLQKGKQKQRNRAEKRYKNQEESLKKSIIINQLHHSNARYQGKRSQ